MTKNKYESPQTRHTNPPLMKIVVSRKNDGPTYELITFMQSAATAETGRLFGRWGNVAKIILKDGTELDAKRCWVDCDLEDGIACIDLAPHIRVDKQLAWLQAAMEQILENGE